MFGFVNNTTSSIFTAVLRAFSFSLPLVHTWAAGDFSMGCFCFPLSSRLSRLQVFLSPGSHSMGCIVKAGIFSPMPVTWERVIDHSCHSFNWQTIWGEKKEIKKLGLNHHLPFRPQEYTVTLHVNEKLPTWWTECSADTPARGKLQVRTHTLEQALGQTRAPSHYCMLSLSECHREITSSGALKLEDICLKELSA